MISITCGIIQLICGVSTLDMGNKIGRLFVLTGLFFITYGLTEIMTNN